jgi:acyl dehydratase
MVLRRFDMSDQQFFAELSGDFNPMHVDPVYARKTQAGAPVVHGMHVVLRALEYMAELGFELSNVSSLKVQFNKFILVGDEIEIVVSRPDGATLRAEVLNRGNKAIVLIAKFGEALADLPSITHANGKTPITAAELKISEMSGLEGSISAPRSSAVAMKAWQMSSAAIGSERVIGLALMSTLVGMVCPGLNSIFTGFKLDMSKKGPEFEGLNWSVIATDPRFMSTRLSVRGPGFAGEVSALVRAGSVAPAMMGDLMSRVVSNEFSNRIALIVGGSRGLGAATAKLLAVGGAKVILTYAENKASAESVAKDIESSFPGYANFVQLDIVSGDFKGLEPFRLHITHLYYFATPRIFHQDAAISNPERLEAFLAIYARGFHDLLEWIGSKRKLAVFYPSSIAVETRPKGMTDYVMAKAAGEILAVDLCQLRGHTLSMPRLPRVLTDQTAVSPPVAAADPVDIMLPLLRGQ